MSWIIILLLLYVGQSITIILLEFKDPSKALGWVFISLCLPLIGFGMYYFLAQDYTARRRMRKRWYMNRKMRQLDKISFVEDITQLNNRQMQDNPTMFHLLAHMSDCPITSGNRSQVLTNGRETFDAIFSAIQGAVHHIHIEFYILRDDAIGTELLKLLMEKASQGVAIRVITDGVGSLELSTRYIQKMKDAGIQYFSFLPLWFSFFRRRLNYRNHRKIVIVDGKVGFIGGLNIGDEYVGRNDKTGFWRDTHLQLEGDAVYELQTIFLHDWAFASGERLDNPIMYPEHACDGHEQVKIVPSGPDSKRDFIQEMYFGAICHAKERVWIATPYFVPDQGIQLALKTAALSGIDVRIIIPERSDSIIVDWASRAYLEPLLLAGVKFYAYQQGFIHAKTFVMDKALAGVGSANLDMRSFFSNFELNAVLFDEQAIERVERDFIMDYADSTMFVYEQFRNRSRKQKMLESLSRLLSPLF